MIFEFEFFYPIAYLYENCEDCLYVVDYTFSTNVFMAASPLYFRPTYWWYYPRTFHLAFDCRFNNMIPVPYDNFSYEDFVTGKLDKYYSFSAIYILDYLIPILVEDYVTQCTVKDIPYMDIPTAEQYFFNYVSNKVANYDFCFVDLYSKDKEALLRMIDPEYNQLKLFIEVRQFIAYMQVMTLLTVTFCYVGLCILILL